MRYPGSTSIATAAAFPLYGLLATRDGTDPTQIKPCGASDKPLGFCPDACSVEGAFVPLHFLGMSRTTCEGIASEAIALDADVYTAADGKLQNLPVVAGTYYKVGRALIASAADGDPLDFIPCEPVLTVIT